MGTFLPFPVQINFQFELGCLSVIDAQNHHGKSFEAPNSRKCPFLKKVLQTIRANGQCPITKKFRKGLPLFCFPIDSIKQINLQRFSVVQGTMTQTFFKALHLTPIEENKAEPNICGIEEQNLEPYSHTK